MDLEQVLGPPSHKAGTSSHKVHTWNTTRDFGRWGLGEVDHIQRGSPLSHSKNGFFLCNFQSLAYLEHCWITEQQIIIIQRTELSYLQVTSFRFACFLWWMIQGEIKRFDNSRQVISEKITTHEDLPVRVCSGGKQQISCFGAGFLSQVVILVLRDLL